jgi:hypothetical protein
MQGKVAEQQSLLSLVQSILMLYLLLLNQHPLKPHVLKVLRQRLNLRMLYIY